VEFEKTQVVLESNQLVPIPRAAEILGVHFTTIYRWVKKGKLHIIQIGNQTYLDAAQIKKMAK